MQLNSSNPLPSELLSPTKMNFFSEWGSKLDRATGKIKGKGKGKASMSLQAKATLLAIALGSLPVLSIGGLAYTMTTQSAIKQRVVTQAAQANAAADKLNRFVFDRYGDIQILADLPILSSPTVRKSVSPRDRQQVLEKFKQTYGIYDNIAVFDLKGKTLLQTSGPGIENPANQDYFKAVLRTETPVVSDPILRGSLEQSSLFFAAPVRDSNTGLLIAVVRSEVKLDRLIGQMKGYGSQGGLNVLDNSGKVLLSFQAKQLGQGIDQVSPEIASLRQGLETSWVSPGLLSGKTAVTQIWQSEPRRAESAAAQNLVGYARTQSLSGMPDLNWEVALTDNVQALLADQRNLALVMLSGSLLSAILITAIAATLIHRAIRPLKDAANTVDQLGQGDLSQRVSISRRDELGLLGTNINRMADRLQGLLHQQTRTAETSQTLNHIIMGMRQSFQKKDILGTAVTELRQALNTSRVIVYEFKNDWCGIITAESVSAGFKKILGDLVEDPFKEGLIDRYRNGRVRVMHDIYTENLTNCHVELLEGFEIKASITAPVLQNGKLIGLLCAHQCNGPRQWEADEVELFKQMAIQLSFTLDQAFLVQKQAEAGQRSEIFSDAVIAMRKSMDADDILQTAVDKALLALKADRAVAYSFNQGWQSGVISAESVAPGWMKTKGQTVEDPLLPDSIERFSNGHISVIRNVDEDGLTACHRDILKGLQIQANIVVPIVREGKLLGLFAVHQCAGPRNWEEEEVELLRQFGIQLGFALDQATLVREQNKSATRWQGFTDTIVQLRKSLDFKAILQIAADQALNFLQVDRVVIYNFNADWKSGAIAAEAVLPGWIKTLGQQVNDPLLPDSVQKFRQGHISVIDNVETAGLTDCHRLILQQMQIQANIVVPVLHNGELIGLLAAHQCSRPRQWEAEEVELFTQIAVQLGFALDQSFLLNEQQRSARRWQGFTDTIVQLRKSLDFNMILQTAADQALNFLQVDRVVIYNFNADWQSGTIAAESVLPGWVKTLGHQVSDPLLPDSVLKFSNGHISVIHNVETAGLTECHKQILQEMEIKANIVVPVMRNGELLGLLAAHQCSTPRQWEAEEIELFRQIAVQLGFALDQAYLLSYTEQARQEARAEADASAQEQRQAKEFLQRRAMELLMEVDPVSKGDLTIRAKVTPDEVGTIADSYNAIIKSLRQIVEQVQVASKSVAETASTNESAVGILSEDAGQQREVIGHAIAELKGLITSIQGVAQRAQRAEMGVQMATESLEAGDAAMDKTVAGIGVIRETVAETSKKVKRLGEASQKISKVVNLISEFAAQTNLLALNAAIEAARAGEEGRGFAVVAEEVRTLAQQSSSATAEIEQLVAEIQAQTNDVVVAMETGTEQVVAGTHLVEESRTKLAQIAEVSRDINVLVKEISQAAVAQTKASTNVSQTMEQVADIATETSKQSETVAESFTHLMDVAQQLQVSVSQFKVK